MTGSRVAGQLLVHLTIRYCYEHFI